MHMLLHGSFQDLTILFQSEQERDQSPVRPIMKKAVSKHSVVDQNLNISALDRVKMQSSCRAFLSCGSLSIKFRASLFRVKIFFFSIVYNNLSEEEPKSFSWHPTVT